MALFGLLLAGLIGILLLQSLIFLFLFLHVASLRQKLEKDPKHPELILTVLGMGYKLKV
jgi:Transcriptional regulatory protein, C terminal